MWILCGQMYSTHSPWAVSREQQLEHPPNYGKNHSWGRGLRKRASSLFQVKMVRNSSQILLCGLLNKLTHVWAAFHTADGPRVGVGGREGPAFWLIGLILANWFISVTPAIQVLRLSQAGPSISFKSQIMKWHHLIPHNFSYLAIITAMSGIILFSRS